MKKELSFVLNYALNKGFQIHPDAFKILDDITDVKKLEKIIKEIVIKKNRKHKIKIPLDGSFANVCTEFSIPDLTKNVPHIPKPEEIFFFQQLLVNAVEQYLAAKA